MRHWMGALVAVGLATTGCAHKESIQQQGDYNTNAGEARGSSEPRPTPETAPDSAKREKEEQGKQESAEAERQGASRQGDTAPVQSESGTSQITIEGPADPSSGDNATGGSGTAPEGAPTATKKSAGEGVKVDRRCEDPATRH